MPTEGSIEEPKENLAATSTADLIFELSEAVHPALSCASEL